MSFGFSCSNENNEIQVDGINLNWRIISSGSVGSVAVTSFTDGGAYPTMFVNSYRSTGRKYTVTFPAGIGANVLIRIPTIPAIRSIAVGNRTSTSQSFVFWEQQNAVSPNFPNLEYIVIAPAVDSSPSGFGLAVYNASGQVVASSSSNSQTAVRIKKVQKAAPIARIGNAESAVPAIDTGVISLVSDYVLIPPSFAYEIFNSGGNPAPYGAQCWLYRRADAFPHTLQIVNRLEILGQGSFSINGFWRELYFFFTAVSPAYSNNFALTPAQAVNGRVINTTSLQTFIYTG